MNMFSGLVRRLIVPAAAVVVVIGGAMGLSAVAHAGSAAATVPGGHCVVSAL